MKVSLIQLMWLVFAIAGLFAVAIPAASTTGFDQFVAEAVATPVSQVLLFDLLFVGIPTVIFAVIESYRLGFKYPWIWAVLSIPLPGAFVLPVFFFVRERHLSRQVQAL